MVAVNTGKKGELRNVAGIELDGCWLEANLEIKLAPELRKSGKYLGH